MWAVVASLENEISYVATIKSTQDVGTRHSRLIIDFKSTAM